ncbi:MAG: DUF4476 domain-containing protein [Alphaproteobacteria bacterium]|nr:DUF4476 domain-containing protein [Alphaproteobacteria bacterium]
MSSAPLALSVLLALSGAARAGDLELVTDGPVRLRVDGERVAGAFGDRWVRVEGLGEGAHELEVRDLLGRLRTSASVLVEGEERLLLHYGDRSLTELGRGRTVAEERSARQIALVAAEASDAHAAAARANAVAARAEAEAAAAQAAAADAAVEAAGVQELFVGPGLGRVQTMLTFQDTTTDPAASPGGLGGGSGGVATASASFGGLDPTRFAVRLGGRPVPFNEPLAAFVAADLLPGTAPLEIWLDERVALSSTMTTEAGQHIACTVLVRRDGYDTGCVAGGAPLTVADLREPAADPRTPVLSMPERLLQVLLESVDEARYQRDKVAVLEAAARRHPFSCAQVVRVLEPLQYNDDRLAAMRALRPAVVDPENHELILEVFPYKSDQDEVKAMFGVQSVAAGEGSGDLSP